jgi:hypothetical protein
LPRSAANKRTTIVLLRVRDEHFSPLKCTPVDHIMAEGAGKSG